jgi:aminoglycoside phosphotransferase (APT) family kinase protein
MSGGFWASMWRLEVTGQPAEVPGDLVLRVAPDSAMGAKEVAVHRAVADQGYATPRVRLAGPDHPALGGSWTVMDFATGTPPLDGLDGFAALRRAPSLFRQLPAQLASAMADLHRLGPEPVSDAVRSDAPTVAWTPDDVLEELEIGAKALERANLAAALRALATVRPQSRSSVVCHGDLHPFNVLVDAGGQVTVIDWTAAAYADPAYDVAFTTLLLANPPLEAGGALQRAVGPIGRRISGRFLRVYRQANPDATLDNLDWYLALHGGRVLVEYAMRVVHDGDAGAAHPFRFLVPAATLALQRATGTTLTSSTG